MPMLFGLTNWRADCLIFYTKKAIFFVKLLEFESWILTLPGLFSHKVLKI